MSLPKRNEEDFRLRIDTVKQLIDPVYLAETLGFKLTNETPKEFRAACIIHGGDNTTAFRVNKDLKTWCCFTHKCQSEVGNDMFGLVMAVNKCGFMEALEFLEELTGSKTVSRLQLNTFKRKREQQEFVRNNSYGNADRPSIVDATRLKYYKPFRSSLFIEDGFSSEALDYFEIAGGYTDKEGTVRDIIPIHDDKGVLVAYSLRDIRRNTDDMDRKYKLTSGFSKDTVLYNMHRVKDIAENTPMIIVEGFKSVWKLYELGIKNVVACMGSGLTMGQANLLYTYAHKGVVLFYDGDTAGVLALEHSINLLKGKLPIYAEVITEIDSKGKGLDPADLTDEQIFYYLNNYIEEE